MTERGRDERYAMVGKLLAKATSVAGTPEAETFTDHAFALIAKYGVEQLDGDVAAIECRTFVVEGDYLRQRVILLHRIVDALHCAYLYCKFSPTAATVKIYGATRHLDRVMALYEPLLRRMLEEASVSTSAPGLSLEDQRTSWMIGFSSSIHVRLVAAENAAISEADRRDGADGKARIVAVDAERATAAREQLMPNARRARYTDRIDARSHDQGYQAGQGSS